MEFIECVGSNELKFLIYGKWWWSTDKQYVNYKMWISIIIYIVQ